jgi:hypothetical protein
METVIICVLVLLSISVAALFLVAIRKPKNPSLGARRMKIDEELGILTRTLMVLFGCPAKGAWSRDNKVFNIYIMEHLNNDDLIKLTKTRRIEIVKKLGVELKIYHGSNEEEVTLGELDGKASQKARTISEKQISH